MENILKKRVVFITGASSGIGKSCAEKYAENGYNLIISARRLHILNEIKEDLENRFNISVLPLELDVTNRGEVVKKIAELPLEWKEIDILINNAGGALGMEKFQEGSFADWDQMIDANVKGVLYMTRVIINDMIKRDRGHVINIGSIAGRYAYPNGAVYCASKAAVKLISDGLRIDTVDSKIRVTNIEPGLVETDFSKVRFHGDEERAKGVYQGIEALTPEDIADLVFYCSNVPARVQICEVLVTPNNQASATSVYKN